MSEEHIRFNPKNPAIDISDEDHGEISGEFGDSTSMSTRVKDVITSSEAPHPPLPPEEERPATLKDYLNIFESNHLKALIWKNFLWMWRNVGYMQNLKSKCRCYKSHTSNHSIAV